MIVNNYSTKEGLTSVLSNENIQTKEETSKSFSDELTQSNNTKSNQEEAPKIEKKDDEPDLWAMFEDIKSLMKTGATVEELKAMEDMIKEIFKNLQKDPPSAEDIKNAENLLDRLEQMIMELKKRMTGVAIKEENGDGLVTSPTKESLSITLSSGESFKLENLNTKFGPTLINRINNAIEGFKDIRDSKEKIANTTVASSSKEELELITQLKKFQK
ncbi:MAG: hypothetical protein ACNI25_06520 [Halarcobacter sp.]